MNTDHHMARMSLPPREEVERLQAVEQSVKDLRAQWVHRRTYGTSDDVRQFTWLVGRLDACLAATPTTEETA